MIVQKHFERYAEECSSLQRYKRNSFLNWDFVVKRLLFLESAHDNCDYVSAYGWYLKDLSTTNNRRAHCLWWHVLMHQINASGNSGYRPDGAESFDWFLSKQDKEIWRWVKDCEPCQRDSHHTE